MHEPHQKHFFDPILDPCHRVFRIGLCGADVGRFSQPSMEQPELRIAPFGNDFLQEWIGGYMILDGQAAQLYQNGCLRSLSA